MVENRETPEIDGRPTAVGIGELLWDLLPSGKQLGGAPFNFARHCGQLGMEAFPVSRVGGDRLGDEIISVLEDWGINSEYVSRDDEHPTGVVEVELDGDGKPAYEIREDSAWDFMSESSSLEYLASRVDVVCFGTLAQRGLSSRNAILRFLDHMRSSALRVFDVNLRQRYYSTESIEESLWRSSILKLSDEELPVLRNGFSLEGDIEDQLSQLRSRFDLNLVAYTRGSAGSLLMDDSGIDDCVGNAVESGDSIGAGDSFTATLCAGLLQGLPLARINENANKVAAYVCSQRGATPQLPDDLVRSVLAGFPGREL